MVELKNVSKTFGKHRAVVDVSFAAERGELLALLGPSGCGKTTILRTIAGLEYPDAGSIRIDGRDVTRAGIAERGIGFVFQNYALFPHLDVFGNVAFGLRRKRIPRERLRERVRELLALVGLEEKERQYPSQLSGGQRQRVAFARALALEPKLLLLDEPFAALDVHMRRELRSWLKDLHERTHVTTLLVTHDREEAMEMADSIVLLRDGAVVQAGRPDALYETPRDLFAMRFLGDVTALPSPDGKPLYLRPHDLRVEAEPFAGSLVGIVRTALRRGPVLRLDINLHSGQHVTADLSFAEGASFGLHPGSTVHLAKGDSVVPSFV